MACTASMEALKKTRDALKEIQIQLLPFLCELQADTESNQQDDESIAKTAQASMAVALAMGTLRYMGARLRGLDQGRKADDPLRQELNNMRRLMRDLQKKLDESKKKEEEGAAKRKTEEKEDSKDSSDEPASKKKKMTK